MKKIFLSFVVVGLLNANLLDSLLNYTFDEKSLDIKQGEELYVKTYKCVACHGINGEKNSGTFEALSNKSAQELKVALKSYKIDNTYGGKTKFVMQRYAKKLSNKDMDNIIYYIKGKGNMGDDSEPSQKTSNNLYIE